MFSYTKTFDENQLYMGTVNLLRAIGTISPVLRKCYNFSESNEEKWVELSTRLFNFWNLWEAIRNNIIEVYAEIDLLSWGAFLSNKKELTIPLFSNISKIVNLLVIRGVGQEQTASVQSSNPIPLTPVQQKFVETLKRMNKAGLDREELIDEYMEQRSRESSDNFEKWFFSNKGDEELKVSAYEFIFPNWPTPYTVNQVHLYVEFAYEFLRGARVASDNQLNLCE